DGHRHVVELRRGGTRLVGDRPAVGPQAVDDAGEEHEGGGGQREVAFHGVRPFLLAPRLCLGGHAPRLCRAGVSAAPGGAWRLASPGGAWERGNHAALYWNPPAYTSSSGTPVTTAPSTRMPRLASFWYAAYTRGTWLTSRSTDRITA